MITTNFAYEVSLRIAHPSIDPEEVTSTLSIAPTHACKAGSGRTTLKGSPLPGVNRETFWRYRICRKAKGEAGTLPETLAAMNQALSSKREFLRTLRESGGRVEYFIGWFTDFNSGEVLDWRVLQQCGDLGIDLALDVYGHRDDRDA